MHGQGTAAARETVYQETPEVSLLDAIVAASTVAPMSDLLSLMLDRPAVKVRRRLVVRDVVVARQDSDVLCQGGLFGSVEASSTPQGHMAAIQDALFAGAPVPVAARGSVCVVCGDARCGIGPFGAR